MGHNFREHADRHYVLRAMATLEQLQRIFRSRISPDEVLATVPDKPMVNSFERRFRHVAGSINVIPTPGREPCFRQLQKGDNVIYWKAAENDVGVEVIGVAWDEQGNSQIFCGTILPP